MSGREQHARQRTLDSTRNGKTLDLTSVSVNQSLAHRLRALRSHVLFSLSANFEKPLPHCRRRKSRSSRNICELRNVLESAAILSDEGVIEPHHLSLPAKERPCAL